MNATCNPVMDGTGKYVVRADFHSSGDRYADFWEKASPILHEIKRLKSLYGEPTACGLVLPPCVERNIRESERTIERIRRSIFGKPARYSRENKVFTPSSANSIPESAVYEIHQTHKKAA